MKVYFSRVRFSGWVGQQDLRIISSALRSQVYAVGEEAEALRSYSSNKGRAGIQVPQAACPPRSPHTPGCAQQRGVQALLVGLSAE